MISNPRVSVLLPVCNDSAYVDACLDWLTRQKYAQAEFVFRDDASTDDTAAKIERRAQQDPRIRLERNPKRIGRVRQYEKLFYEDSRGEFILVHDGNDHLQSGDFIEKMMAPLEKDPAVVAAIGTITLQLPNVLPIRLNSPVLKKYNVDTYRIFDRKELLEILRKTPIWDLHGNTIVRKKFMLQTGVYREDWFPENIILPFLAAGDRVALVNAIGLVREMRVGVSETDLLGGRCGFGLDLARNLLAQGRKVRPEITSEEISLLFARSWSTLSWSEIAAICKDENGPGKTLRGKWQVLRTRLYCMLNRRLSFFKSEIEM